MSSEPEPEHATAPSDPASLPVAAWATSDPAIVAALAAVGIATPAAAGTPAPSENDLRKCFHQAALRWHPDKNHGSTEAKSKFQEISDAYALLIEHALGDTGGGAAGASFTVVTSAGNWAALAKALEEVCAESDFFPLLVDGTGDGKTWLEMLCGGGTVPRVVSKPAGVVSTNPSLRINGQQVSTTCGAAFRIK